MQRRDAEIPQGPSLPLKCTPAPSAILVSMSSIFDLHVSVRKRERERREEGGPQGMKAVGRERHVRLLLTETDACAYSKDVVSAQTFLSVSASRRREQQR